MNNVLNPIHPTYGFPVPLTLKCTVTGKENVFTDPDYIKQRIERAGGLEKLLSTYVCKAAKREMKAGTLTQEGEQKPAAIEPTPAGAIREQWSNGTVLTRRESGGRTHLEFKFKDGTFCNVYAPSTSAHS